MRNILNVIADILILVALVIAGVGHMLPWFRSEISAQAMARIFQDEKWKDKAPNRQLDEAQRQMSLDLMAFQAWHASRSGIALGVLAGLVALSLVMPWRPFARRILVLLMFASALTAIVFIVLSMTHYPITEEHRRFAGTFRTDAGFFVALVPTCCAAGLCLIRMIWTMPPVRGTPAPRKGLPEAMPVPQDPAPLGKDSARNPGFYSAKD